MKLPRAPHPFYETTLPSSGRKIGYRPMLAREEKILLLAKEAKDNNEIMNGIKQVVQNCVSENNLDVNNLATVDVDWLFLKIRMASQGQKINIIHTDEFGKETKLEVDLHQVTTVFPLKDEDKTIKIGQNLAITMRYPRAEIYGNPDLIGSGEDVMDRFMIHCMDTIFEGEKSYNVRDADYEEALEFLNSLDLETIAKIRTFLQGIPHLSYVLEFKDAQGRDQKIELRSLSDFFQF